jgi:hypothetical protein
LFEQGVAAKATRVNEGYETDHYVCAHGHRFGIDWARGPATEPQWPPPAELVEAARRERDRGDH